MANTLQYRLVLQGSRLQVEQAANFMYELSDSDKITAVDLGEGAGEDWQTAIYFTGKPVPEDIVQELAGYMDMEGVVATLEEIPDLDWVAKVQSDLAPVRAGRFLVHGSHDRALAQGQTFAIEIDAGAAFGTAHHGTTSGCLEVIDGLLKFYHPIHALDLGTGTGVLALAVAMETRRAVLATDIDPVCVEITKKNSHINGMKRLIKVYEAAGFALPVFNHTPKFDLVIANILAEPLMKLGYEIGQRMEKGGHLVLSGILQTQSRQVIATYRNHGFYFVKKVVKDVEREGWTTLHMRKK